MEQLPERQILQNVPKLLILMQFMIPFMRWLVMRLDMEKHLKDFLRDTLGN